MASRLGRFRFARSLRGSARRAGAEVTLVVVLVGLAVGLIFGKGIAQTLLHTSDGLVWLSDSKRGEVVQVNPDTGRPENRLKVGAPGDDIDVAQRDGLLITTNRKTGVVTIIDLSTLLTSGQRMAGAGATTKVLVSAGHLYLVDRSAGTVEQIDPLSAATIGKAWFAGGPLADATVDGDDTVWALKSAGDLVALKWSDTSHELVRQLDRPVDGADPGAVLVAHDKGVTVLSPNTGAVVQVGTGNDFSTVVSGLGAPLHAAGSSPADLVPASVEATSTVVLARDGHVLKVDVGAMGCARPGTPVPYRGVVYVPCLGARKVIVLTPDGRSGGADIATPGGGDAQLVVDDGVLIINVPGANTGILVSPNGSTRSITLFDPVAPVHDPGKHPTATALPPGLGDRPSHTPKANPPNNDQNQAGGNGNQSATAAPRVPLVTSPSPSTTASPPVGPDRAPTGVTAQARADGSVLVSWTPGNPAPSSYRVLRTGSTDIQVATAAGSATSAIVTSVAPGDNATFVVEATVGTATYRSAPSGAVTAYSRPSAPANVRASVSARDANGVTVSVSWDPAATNGSVATAYDATVSGNFAASPIQSSGHGIGQQPYQFTVPCAGSTFCTGGGSLDVDVAVTNAAGTGPSARAHLDVPAVPPPPPPPPQLPPAGVTVITSGGGSDIDDSDSELDVVMAPPSGWATYGGTCELFVTRGTTATQAGVKTIACNATSAWIDVAGFGAFAVRVRAFPTGNPSAYADSATYAITVRRPPVQQCRAGQICQLADAARTVPVAQLAAFPIVVGLGLGGLLVTRRRRRKEPRV